jgi:hypothetical protein
MREQLQAGTRTEDACGDLTEELARRIVSTSNWTQRGVA